MCKCLQMTDLHYHLAVYLVCNYLFLQTIVLVRSFITFNTKITSKPFEIISYLLVQYKPVLAGVSGNWLDFSDLVWTCFEMVGTNTTGFFLFSFPCITPYAVRRLYAKDIFGLRPPRQHEHQAAFSASGVRNQTSGS